MKLLIFCAAFFAVSYGNRANDLSSLYEYIEKRQALEEIVTAVDGICPGYGATFEEKVLVNITDCVNSVDETKETKCSGVKKHFKTCMKPATDMFESCLPEKIRYIPELAVNIVLSVTNHLCQSTGEEIYELSNNCIREPSYKADRCMRMAKSNVRQMKSGQYLTKNELCQVGNNLKNCAETFVNQACGNLVTRRSFLKFIDAVLAPCKTVENEIEYVSVR